MDISFLWKQRAVEANKFTMIFGALYQSYSYTSFIQSVMRTAIDIFMVWGISTIIDLKWANIPLIIIIILCVLTCGIATAWHIIIPHMTAYGNRMGYKHDNLIRRDIAQAKKEILEALRDETS